MIRGLLREIPDCKDRLLFYVYRVVFTLLVINKKGDSGMYQNCSDVLIHIDEDLDDSYIHDLEKELSHMDGVYSACVHERARHLMLVDFDPEDIKAAQLLQTVSAHGLHAELVGL